MQLVSRTIVRFSFRLCYINASREHYHLLKVGLGNMKASMPCVVLLLAFLGGCSSAPVEHFPEPSVETITGISSPEQVVFPIDSYIPSVDQTVQIIQKEVDLVNECIQGGGETKLISLLVQNDSTDDPTRMDPEGDLSLASSDDLTRFITESRKRSITDNTVWGFFDPDTVAQFGYSLAQTESTSVVVDADRTDTTVNDCVIRVSSVTPGDGDGTSIGSDFITADLPDGGPGWHSGDSRYLDAQEQWSQCMSKQGFQYDTPIEAMFSDAIISTETDEQKATMIAIAVADVQCKIDTNLLGVAVAVESVYQQEYIDSYQDQLAEQQTQIADYIDGNIVIPDSLPTSEPS